MAKSGFASMAIAIIISSELKTIGGIMRKEYFLAAAIIVCASGAHAADMGKARSNYQLHCATCHGVKGDGNGDLAEALGEGIKPRNHTDAKLMSKRSDADLFKVISEGGESMGFNSAMPPFNTLLSKDEINGLVAYLRELCKCKHE